MVEISRQAYADMYGPTVGDKVRLADTELLIQVEKDFTVYGDEVKFGGGKVIRDGMGQGQLCRDQVMDCVITNALILDHWGIVKADIGIKDGHIAAIGKAGNKDIQPQVTINIGASTEVIAGEGHIGHGGCRGCAYTLYLSTTNRRSANGWNDDHDRGRYGASYGHQRHDLHTWRMEYETNAS